MTKIKIYDCTLREGSQAPHISFTLQDKLRIIQIFDDLGFDYSEGGWPASNPKDYIFFKELHKISLKNIIVVGFASTFSANKKINTDDNIRSLTKAGVRSAHLFGKAWTFHVEKVLKMSLEENLENIYTSIQFYKKYINEVSFGAEHFFDGYKDNPDYVDKLLEVVVEAGADWIDLPDTNGGTLPHEIGPIVSRIHKNIPVPLAIHCHNDSGCAVANTIAAVQHGVTIVEGTVNGYSERCEMTDLCTLIPNLQIKLGYDCIPREKLKKITSVAHAIEQIVQRDQLQTKPYVGTFAFSHKGGLHIDAFKKNPATYQHIDPALVGNTSRVYISDQSGYHSLDEVINQFQPPIQIDSEQQTDLLKRIKECENQGYQFDVSQPALELLILRHCNLFIEHVSVEDVFIKYQGNTKTHNDSGFGVSCNVKIMDEDKQEVFSFENQDEKSFASLADVFLALIAQHFPQMKTVILSQHEVRLIYSSKNKPDRLRVLVRLNLANEEIVAFGFGKSIIDGGLNALVEGVEYILNRRIQFDRRIQVKGE